MNDRIQLKRAARVLFHWPRAQAGEEVPLSVRGLAAVPSHLVNDRPSPPLLPGSGGGMQPLPPLSYGGGGGGSAASLLRGDSLPGGGARVENRFWWRTKVVPVPRFVQTPPTWRPRTPCNVVSAVRQHRRDRLTSRSASLPLAASCFKTS